MRKTRCLMLPALVLLSLLLIACGLTGGDQEVLDEGAPSPVTAAPKLAGTTVTLPVESPSLPPTQKVIPTDALQQARGQLVPALVEGQPLAGIMDLWVSPQGDLWAATLDGIYIHTAEGWRRELKGVAIGKIAGSGSSGVVWALPYSTEAIFAYSGEKWKEYSRAQGWEPFHEAPYLSPGVAESVIESPERDIWLATGRDDLRRYDPDRDQWEKFTAEQIGFPAYDEPDYQGYFLTDVAISGSGKVWVGSCIGQGELLAGRGVVRFSNGQWSSIDAVETACVLDIEVLPDGDAYVGDYNHLFWYTPVTGNWRKDILPAFERFQLVERVDVDASGQLWVQVRRMGGASSFGGMAVYYKQKYYGWVLVYESEGWADYDFAADPGGDVYFSSNGVVYRWRDRQLEELGALQATSTLLAVDGSGAVWAAPTGGSDDGLWQVAP
ncbi:MAG: hypothetical protein HPY59_08585 [Anaerolineae bacterium]|nr:hypothetical protein [Anaerolineae bacterium]